VNTILVDDGPTISPDGSLLFLHSNRDGGVGARDLWVSHRVDPNDDLGWGTPVNLGPLINTTLDEQGPDFLPSTGELYFQRGMMGTPSVDIFVARISADLEVLEPGHLVAELSDLTVNDGHPAINGNGTEIIIASGRAGGLGNLDLWVSRRATVNDPWTAPEPLGSPVNGPLADQTPSLSFDGLTLFFAGAPARGVFGGNDIWMSTRVP
jgi:hypothetical protein